MVDRANHRFDGLGGHLSTYASAAALYEVGFNHFFRGKGDGGYGDQVFFQGHAAPGIYARAFLEGRLTEEQLDHFRRETDGRGLPSYPHPRRLPTFWEFPTVSMGLGPLNAVYQARFNRYLYNRQIVDTSNATRVVLRRRRRDGRAGIDGRARHLARARAARQPDLRRQLQPAAPRRSGARQRQGDPGVRVDVPRHGLERDQGRVGPAVGRPARPRRRRCARQQDEHHARRRVPEVRGRVGRVHPRALLRTRSAAAQDGRAPLRRRAAAAAARRSRLPQALRGVQDRGRARGRADGDPRQDREGLDARHRLRGAQRDAPDQEDVARPVEGVPRSPLPRDPRRRPRRRLAPYFHPGSARPSTST